jgi:cell division septal protein FtsQ
MLLNKIAVLLCAVFLLGTILSLFTHESFASAEIKISGESATDEATLAATVNNIAAENFLFVFRRDNILFFPVTRVRRELEAKFPRIREIKIKPTGLNQIEVKIIERQGDFLWCRSEDECFLLDGTGFVYAPAPYFGGNAFLRFRSEDSLEIGDVFLPPGEIGRVIRLKENLATLGFEGNDIEITEADDYEFLLAGGGKIIVNKKNNFDAAFANLEAAIVVSPLDKKLKDERAGLAYLDLRFENRVIYKFE